MWTPITLEELSEQISESEKILIDELLKFWQLIKITPEKWIENEYGKEGGGFWVVGIFGKNVIWYNDIEDGFNVSKYKNYGTISKCGFEQFDLNQIVYQVYNSLLMIE
jgi:hypothetical protein